MFGTEARQRASMANLDPPAVEHEEQLLDDLRRKTGPFSDEARLLHHIRSARGKLFWAGMMVLTFIWDRPFVDKDCFVCTTGLPLPRAVNSYFREVLVSVLPGQLEDFEARPPVIKRQRNHGKQQVLLTDGQRREEATEPRLSFTGSAADRNSSGNASGSVAQQQQGGDAPASCNGGCSEGSLDCFPSALLEEVLLHVGARTMCQAAQVSTAFQKVRREFLSA